VDKKNIVIERTISAAAALASKYDVLIISVVLILIITLAISTLICSAQSIMAEQQRTLQPQQPQADKIYHSNATGATITFHGNSITSKTSNVTDTNNSGITGFGPKNSMRNMTNPMFLMNKNPLTNLSNPLANMTNPLAK
jgi:hypothetical protein